MTANPYYYNGLMPLRKLDGGPIVANRYQILTSGTTGFNDTIREGDPVSLASDGTVYLSAAGDVLLGVFGGCTYTASDGSFKFAKQWAASTAVDTSKPIYALVYDDKNIVYGITGDTTASAQTQVGNNADFAAGTGNSYTGKSGAYLDVANVTSATANLRIIGIQDLPDNVVGNTKARYEVIINEHFYSTTTGV